MLLIGLTGGIGSGKSTVAQRFAQLGIPVIDADVVARQLVEPGQPALQTIAEQFGSRMLNADGSLNRRALRQQVFANPEQRRQLEAILHPLIRAEMQRQITLLDSPYCILSIPLLIESGWLQSVARVLVVDAPPELQIQRAMQRDHASRETIQAIIDSQVTRQSRLAAADDVITNSGDIASLEAQVDTLHKCYLELARRG